jgi:hypothetical protein
MAASHLDPHSMVARVRRERAGFLQESDVAALAAHPEARLWRLLVRCGGGRFIAPAQDVAHFIALVERGGDYVRDVSLLAGERYGAAS